MDVAIKRAIVSILNNKDIVESWGISNVAVNTTSFSFNVSGFAYQGFVEVRCSDSSYHVRFGNGVAVICDLSGLIETLDDVIEKTPDYIDALEDWVGKQINY